ncbi:hypothetical protein GCAAIG_02080 [Candidatus Electronema halotolerans]
MNRPYGFPAAVITQGAPECHCDGNMNMMIMEI